MKIVELRIERLLRALALAGAALVPGAAAGHDFWLQPEKFFLVGGDATSLALQAGHGPDRHNSSIPARRIKRFVQYAPDDKIDDLREMLGTGKDTGSGKLIARTPGIHLFVLESDDKAKSHLPARRFNAYLKDEGLARALNHRVTNDLMDEDGAERYSRVAKALVQAGPPGTGSQKLATATLGLPLEIVFDHSPSIEPRPALLSVHVIYEGRPLVGGLVKLTDLEHDADPVETQLTDAHGRAHFRMPERGSWLLNVIWSKPVHRGDGIDFETIFSSLSFGVPK